VNSYIPQSGHQVIVSFEDLGFQVATINDVATDSSWLQLAQGAFMEQRAARDSNGVYRLQESGQLVFLLDPHAIPETDSTGFVLPTHDGGPVEAWHIGPMLHPDHAEGFLHAEQCAGMAHIRPDGTWKMNDAHQIFFISPEQTAVLHAWDTDEEEDEEETPMLEPVQLRPTYYQVAINGKENIRFAAAADAEYDNGWEQLTHCLDMLLGGWLIEYFRSKDAIGHALVDEETYLAISRDWDVWHYLDGRDVELPYEITLPALNPRLKERHIVVTENHGDPGASPLLATVAADIAMEKEMDGC
jgi:hypothetical protein